MTISLRIKELIKEKKLSQKDVASALVIDTSQFSKIVNGKLQPTLSQLMELSSILKTSLDWLCFGKSVDIPKELIIYKDLADSRLEIIDMKNEKIRDLEKKISEMKYLQRDPTIYRSVAESSPELIEKESK